MAIFWREEGGGRGDLNLYVRIPPVMRKMILIILSPISEDHETNRKMEYDDPWKCYWKSGTASEIPLSQAQINVQGSRYQEIQRKCYQNVLADQSE